MSTFFKTHRLAFGLAAPVVLLGTALVAAVGFHPTPPWASAQSSGCSFLSSPNSTPAFCDTFDSPAGTGNRSGDLNGTVWGVSRLSQSENPWSGQYDNWLPTTLNLCGTNISVHPESDVRICNGHIAEAQNDGDAATTLAMYPKQPFDIAGRTGTVEFDVSNDTQGPHAAWPEFWYTDQPVPAPFTGFPGNHSAPRNGLGLRFHNTCTTASGAAGWAFGSLDLVSNYTNHDSFFGGSSASVSSPWPGCVSQGSASSGTLNHVELRISTSRVDVYATDAFKPGNAMPALQHIATITNITLPLTRGLIWITDAHYNGNKMNNQGTHTFYWDNVAFDGPVLPQDRAFDVLDNNDSQGNLGWRIPAGGSQSLSVPNVTSSSITNATGALVTFNFWTPNAMNTFHVSVNGHSYNATFSTAQTYANQSYAIPINVSDVVPGTNTVTFTGESSSDLIVANVDIIMVGGGGASSGSTSGSAPSSAPTSTPTSTSTAPSPFSVNNVPCTVTINGQQQTGTCNGSFTPSK